MAVLTPRIPKVIGITGYATVGKDTAAEHIVSRYHYEHDAFANRLRRLVTYANPVVGFEEKNGHPEPIHYKDAVADHGYYKAKAIYPLLRQVLVGIGEGARIALHDSIWLDAVLPLSYDGKDIVVSDVRYPNESKRVKELGGIVIRIEREGVGPANQSEAKHIPSIEVDYVVPNNGTIQELGEKIDRIMGI